jgi:LAGLIDADG DNA endonuclease family
MCASNVLLRERFEKKKTGKVYNTLHFSTISLPFFNLYYELFYDKKVKVVP